jgi:hypothetical protein
LNFKSKRIYLITEDENMSHAVQELIYEQLAENGEYEEDDDEQEWVTVETQEILQQGQVYNYQETTTEQRQ